MAPSLLALLLLLKAPGAAPHGQQRGAPRPWGEWAADGGSASPKFGVAAGNAEVFGSLDSSLPSGSGPSL